VDDYVAMPDTKRAAVRCPSGGDDVGRMIEIPRSDDWHIKCPACGAWWSGGSTVLVEHDRPGTAQR
jgi:hypothetical protein